MDYFEYANGQLHCEGLPVAEIAQRAGTPTYLYSARTVRHHLERLTQAFAELDPLICYSVKANANLALLKLVRDTGAGFDVVSGGELFRALRAGADPSRIVYAGVGKTDGEITYALKHDVLMFNVESAPELHALNQNAATLSKTARVALRINPDVEAHSHAYITTGKKENKFGLAPHDALELVRKELPRLKAVQLRGVHAHIGSQITETEPYEQAVRRVVDFVENCATAGHPLTHLNMGGGFGIFYTDHAAKYADELAEVIIGPAKTTGLKLVLEPGRFVVGNAGVLLTRVLFVKKTPAKRFVIVDAGMNDLIRPALYQAEHVVWPVESDRDPRTTSSPDLAPADVVGPICETGDFLAKDRPFPDVQRGDLIAVFSAGAYSMTMSSNYNARPRAAEVLISDGKPRLVRRRETWDDLVAPELEPRDL